jgi:hypothetical protein
MPRSVEPLATPALAERCRELVAAADTLRARDPEDTVRTLAAVSARFQDPESLSRRQVEPELAARSGYSLAVVGAALDDLFGTLDEEALSRLLELESADLPSRRPRLVLHVSAGTVFPPAIVGPVTSLLLGAPCLVKPASEMPALSLAWIQALEEEDAELARAVAVLPWSRRRDDLTRCALSFADTAIVHGDDLTIETITHLAPAGAHVVGHGHRVSAALCTAEAVLAPGSTAAAGLARDVALYDQRGCLSPHTVFVVENGGGDVVAVGDALAAAMRQAAEVLPRGRLSPQHASSVRQVADSLELLCYSAGGRSWGQVGRGFLLLADRHEPARFRPSPGGRTVLLQGVADIEQALLALAPWRSRLQGVAVAGGPEVMARVDTALNGAPADRTSPPWARPVRVCPPGKLQTPPITWCADGHRPLASQCPPGSWGSS